MPSSPEYSKAWRKRNKARCAEYSRKNRPRYQQWRDDNKLRIKNLNQIRLYGITLEQRDAIFMSQNYKCAACGDAAGTRKGWTTDHDHDTGKVRGILCQPCNLIAGHAVDSPKHLRLVADYLEKYK